MFDDNEFPDLEVSYPEKDPIYTNADGLKFFNKCDYGDMRVEVGDIVRIRLVCLSCLPYALYDVIYSAYHLNFLSLCVYY